MLPQTRYASLASRDGQDGQDTTDKGSDKDLTKRLVVFLCCWYSAVVPRIRRRPVLRSGAKRAKRKMLP